MVSMKAKKGNPFEMDCEESLKQKYPKARRTHETGYFLQYDIQNDEGFKFVVECKRLKGISWNQLVKLYKKLDKVSPIGYHRYILFKSNRQPCLVFTQIYSIMTFEDFFGVPFVKHTSIKRKKQKIDDLTNYQTI